MVKWTEEEINVLRKYFPNPEVTYNDLAKILPLRTPMAIQKKTNQMGLKKSYKTVDKIALINLRKVIKG